MINIAKIIYIYAKLVLHFKVQYVIAERNVFQNHSNTPNVQKSVHRLNKKILKNRIIVKPI